MTLNRKVSFLTALAMALTLLVPLASCSGSKFAGGGTVKNPTTNRNSSNQLPGTMPGVDGLTDLSEGGRNILKNRFNDFLFAGAGPGSCGLPPTSDNTCRIPGGRGLRCPDGYQNIGAVGDCYPLPPGYGISMQCTGNRPLCQKTAHDDPDVVIEVRMVEGSNCPEGFTGDPSNSHVLGVVAAPPACNSYSSNAFCKKTVPLSSLTPGASIVSAIAIMGTDAHQDIAPACPAGFTNAGTAPDCSNYTGNTAIQCCKGRVTFCQKREVVN